MKKIKYFNQAVTSANNNFYGFVKLQDYEDNILKTVKEQCFSMLDCKVKIVLKEYCDISVKPDRNSDSTSLTTGLFCGENDCMSSDPLKKFKKKL